MRREHVQDRIASDIRRRIADGFYAPGTMLPKQRDLAREFGTSPTTMSRLLQDIEKQGLVVQKRSVGIRVVPVEERTAHGAVGILGLSVASPDPTGARLLRGARDVLTRRHQHYHVSDEFSDPSTVSVDAITSRYSGALFMQGLGFEHLFAALEARQFPCVVAQLEKDVPISCTWVDHGKSTRTAVRLLAALGHSRIGLITRPAQYFFYDKVLAAYREAVREAGLCDDESLVVFCEARDADSACERVREYLAAHRSPTAWVGARDYLAGGACRALIEKSLVIGRDVSVIGFDDTSWPQPHPFLTTFEEPNVRLGGVAAEMLVERLIGGWSPAERREIEAPLILRLSAGPCQEDGTRVRGQPLWLWNGLARDRPAQVTAERRSTRMNLHNSPAIVEAAQ